MNTEAAPTLAHLDEDVRTVRAEIELLLGVCHLPDEHPLFREIVKNAILYRDNATNINLHLATKKALVEFGLLPAFELKHDLIQYRRRTRKEKRQKERELRELSAIARAK